MKKTLISLDSEDKAWLEKYSYLQKQSLAESVRQAIKALRKQQSTIKGLEALSLTSGVWKGRAKDGLELQKTLRDEWD